MTEFVQVLATKTDPMLHLLVSRPTATDRAVAVQGQKEVKEFHVTLVRSDDLGLELDDALMPANVPRALGLKRDVLVVESGRKRSCYVEIDEAGQAALKRYVRDWEATCGTTLLDEARVFHVTLSNADDGHVRSSVGEVWKHPSRVV